MLNRQVQAITSIYQSTLIIPFIDEAHIILAKIILDDR